MLGHDSRILDHLGPHIRIPSLQKQNSKLSTTVSNNRSEWLSIYHLICQISPPVIYLVLKDHSNLCLQRPLGMGYSDWSHKFSQSIKGSGHLEGIVCKVQRTPRSLQFPQVLFKNICSLLVDGIIITYNLHLIILQFWYCADYLNTIMCIL